MARKKEKTPIPSDKAARVLFLSHRTCCVCRIPKMPMQIHHIDGNPSNHALENLAILCLVCHRDTQIRGGFDRKLDAEQIKLYRDDWHRIVAEQRAVHKLPQVTTTWAVCFRTRGTMPERGWPTSRRWPSLRNPYARTIPTSGLCGRTWNK